MKQGIVLAKIAISLTLSISLFFLSIEIKSATKKRVRKKAHNKGPPAQEHFYSFITARLEKTSSRP